ncbi:MAG: glycosyltransferase [Vicinamibacterales bacterium]
MKKKVLAVSEYYLPGFRGGTIYSLANIVSRLSDRYEFWILTTDRDVTETAPYTGITPGQWTPVGAAMVCYISPPGLTLRSLRTLVGRVNPDMLFVLSAFSRTTVRLLLLRWLRLLIDRPMLVAPEGEFTAGALQHKPARKRVFLKVAEALELHARVNWRATTPEEAEDIRRVIGSRAPVFLAPCVPEQAPVAEAQPLLKRPGQVNFVYLSRITPKKNLLFALERLGETQREIALDVLGPIEDPLYWAQCVSYAERHCPRIDLRYCGEVPHASVTTELGRRHFLLLPSLGENFGYVILEALACGRPVVLSDRTPWRALQAAGAGWDIDLLDTEAWRRAIVRCVDMADPEYQLMVVAASVHARGEVNGTATEAAIATAFDAVMAGHRAGGPRS